MGTLSGCFCYLGEWNQENEALHHTSVLISFAKEEFGQPQITELFLSKSIHLMYPHWLVETKWSGHRNRVIHWPLFWFCAILLWHNWCCPCSGRETFDAHLLSFLPSLFLISLFTTDKLPLSYGVALTQGSETLPASVTLISLQVGFCNY